MSRKLGTQEVAGSRHIMRYSFLQLDSTDNKG